MSQHNGSDIKARTRAAREEARLLEAELRLGQLQRVRKRQQRLTENQEAWEWIGAWQDVVDRLRGPERDLVQPVSTAMDRRYGDNWPFWRGWIEHARYRASARLVCQMSNQARGAVGGLSGYVIGDGFTHRAAAKRPDCPPELVGAVQETLDEFGTENRWNEWEQELFSRDRVDGESLARYWPQDDGMLRVSTVEPMWILDHPSAIPEVGKYGVLTDEENLEHVTGFWVCDTGDSGQGEEVPADEMWFSKPANVPRIVKRGMSDFTFEAYGMLKAVGRMLENMIEGGAIQASIAFIRQHEGSGSDQVGEFVSGVSDYEEFNNTTGRTEKVERFYPGKILDTGKNTQFVPPPFAQGTQNWVAILDAGMRSVASRWNAPEWLLSSNANNMGAYTSSLVAEAPFNRYCTSQHRYYGTRFREVQWKAVKARCDAGKLKAGGRVWSYDEVRRYIDITSEPPKLTVRDPLQKAQENQVKLQAQVLSPQQWCQEDGRDYEQTVREIEEHGERTGGQGDALPGGDDGGEGLAGLMQGLGEAITESGFTGTVKDSIGRERHYVDGKQVAGHHDTPAPDQHGDTQTAQKAQGILSRVAGRVKQAVQGAVQKALAGLDEESKGGVSLIAGGLSLRDPRAVAYGAAQIVSAVFSYVHQEVYENAMSEHSLPGAHLAGKVASTVLTGGERALLGALAHGLSALAGTSTREAEAEPVALESLGAADQALLGVAVTHARAALQHVYDAAGVHLDAPDEDATRQRLFRSLVPQSGVSEGLDPRDAVEVVRLMEAGFTGQKQVTVRGKVQTWHYQDGKRVAGPKKDEGKQKKGKEKAEKPARMSVEDAVGLIAKHVEAGKVDQAGAKELAQAWMALTKEQMGQLRQKLGIKGTAGDKAKLAETLATRAIAAAKAKAAQPGGDEHAKAHAALSRILGDLKALDLGDDAAVRAALAKAMEPKQQSNDQAKQQAKDTTQQGDSGGKATQGTTTQQQTTQAAGQRTTTQPQANPFPPGSTRARQFEVMQKGIAQGQNPERLAQRVLSALSQSGRQQFLDGLATKDLGEYIRQHSAAKQSGPQKQPGRPGSLSRADLKQALAAQPANEFELAPELTAMARLMEQHGKDAGPVCVHGMEHYEDMTEIEVDGVKVQWSEATKEQAAGFLAKLAGADVPPKLYGPSKTITFSAQRNYHDDHWAKKYKMPGFRSAATGGSLSICVYDGELSLGSYTHEAGHNLATAVWGDTAPPPDSEFGKLQQVDAEGRVTNAVSDYGANSRAEDFAEAARLYMGYSKGSDGSKKNPAITAAFKKAHPAKYEAVRKLIEG